MYVTVSFGVKTFDSPTHSLDWSSEVIYEGYVSDGYFLALQCPRNAFAGCTFSRPLPFPSLQATRPKML